MNVVLLDPGISRDGDTNVNNLGDLIISEAVNSVVSDIVPEENLFRISSHSKFKLDDLRRILFADFVFLGGTNLLSSYFNKMNRPLGPNRMWHLIVPRLRNVVLLGVGWGYGYGEDVSPTASRYYKRIFKKGTTHSVRDSYSTQKLLSSGINKVVNTNCPTLWTLNGTSMDLLVNKNSKKYSKCIFTLTDYGKDYGLDDQLLSMLGKEFRELIFFPQGKWDAQYLKMLPSYSKLKDRIVILERSLKAYDSFVSTASDTLYIGTRLHGGIRCLQKNIKSLVVSIDNRAMDISNDTGLAVVSRGDIKGIKKWIDGKSSYGDLRLDLIGIDSFLNQFK